MPNLRVVYDNAVDRAAITADSTTGSLVANNLKTDIKSEVWRSSSLTPTIKVNWTDWEFVNCVAFPFCSLSPSATVRVRGYSDVDYGGTLVFDTGAVVAAAPMVFESWEWGDEILGVNAYSYGGGTYGVVWIDDIYQVKSLQINISDTLNPLGYVEASRLVAGKYWSPENNADSGAQVASNDTSKHQRTEAGDLRTDIGTMSKSVSFDLSVMTANDRNAVWRIMRGNGMAKPMFVSLVPETYDPLEEQTFMIYGKLSKQSAIKYQFSHMYASSIDIEEI